MFGCAAALASSAVVDGLAGGVGGVRDAPHRVPALARQVQAQRPVGSGVKGTPCPTSHSTAEALRSAMKRAVCSSTRPAPASWVSRTWLSTLSSLTQHADDAALRPGGGGLVQFALGQHDHRQAVGQVQRDGQAGQAGTDDDDRLGHRPILGRPIWHTSPSCPSDRTV
jgi:hypothetical protein